MLIDIRDINYYYPNSNKKALENINIKFDDGDFVLITGHSGSSKSTLVKTITGAVPNFYGGKISGHIYIDGEDILNINESRKTALISMVFQDPERQLLMNKVYREIAFGLENLALDESTIKKRIWESLEFCGITELYDRDIQTLSGGQKQKVAIASALSFMPKCIILDEPTSQLDPVSADEILNIAKKINKELMINVIVVEQRVSRWFDHVDKVVVMKDGKIRFSGTREEMFLQDDKEILDYLPSRIKVAKRLGMECYPRDNREIKKLIDSKNLKNITKKIIDNEKLLQVKNLIVKYENFLAVKDVSFDINKGEITALLGSNGAGKSTILKSIIGLLNYKGSITLDGEKIDKQKIKDRAKYIGYLSQNPNDYITKETVYDELKFTLDNFRITDYCIIDDMLKRLDIYKLKDKNPRDLSGGEKQRLALANALILRPKLLLLDEPTRGIDSKIKEEIKGILKDLANQGISILLITHDIEFASDIADKFMIMFDGEIVDVGDSKVLEDCIYYTTEINKLTRQKQSGIFTYKHFENALEGNE